MGKCINLSHPEFKNLAETSGLDPLILASKIKTYWEKTNNTDIFPTLEELNTINNNVVNFQLKAVDILLSDKAKQVFAKGEKAGWDLNKILTELATPKEQKQLILSLGKTNREEIITDLLVNYSYTIEINTAKEKTIGSDNSTYTINGIQYVKFGENDYRKRTENSQFEKISQKEFVDNQNKPTQHYSYLTVPGGTNYTENEIATPLITPSIKGHAQFATDNGIGWFRSDDKENKVLGWKEENDFLNSETAQYNPITKNDKIIWGHPAIGKSYAAKKVKMIDFDSYKIDINRKYNLHITKGLSDTELRTDNKTREARENWRYKSEENQALWNQFIRDAWQQAKKDAKEQGAILFASDLLVLREFGNEVDKALTMPDELFFERSKQRNNFIEGELGTKVWKSNLNKAINNFQDKYGKDKVIKTDKYLSDLLEGNPKTRRILEIQSDLFQKGRDKEDLVTKTGSFDTQGSYDNVFANGYFYTRKYYGTDENNIYYRSGEEISKEQYYEEIDDSKKINPNTKENQFLQLLNKDNNWVTFFVKSIIQDSAKKGYEKVLFPRLDTIIQIESQNRFKTYKEAEAHYKNEKWQLEDEELRKTLREYQQEFEDRKIAKKDTKEVEQAIINQKERIRSHQPTLLNTANFYEYELANRLDDIAGGNKNNRAKGIWALNQITDEFGNAWNEVTIDQNKNLDKIFLSKKSSQTKADDIDKSLFNVLKHYNISTNGFMSPAIWADKLRQDLKKAGFDSDRVRIKQTENKSYFVTVNKGDKWKFFKPGDFFFYQIKESKLRKERNKELDIAMQKFFETFGFQYESVSQIEFNGEVLDNIALANTLTKVVQVIEGKATIDTLPEEAAHIFVELMGEEHPMVKRMLEIAPTLPIFEEVYNDYYDIYNGDQLKLAKETVGKVIAQHIVGTYTGDSVTDQVAKTWWQAIWAWITNRFRPNNPFKQAASEILNTALRQIPKEQVEPVNMEETTKEVKPSFTKMDYTGNNMSELKGANDEIFYNFEQYFPNYSYLTTAERVTFVELVNDGKIQISCKI